MEELYPLLAIEASLLALVLRGTVVYWSLYLMFRIAGRRNIGALGFADLVVMMVVASAVGDSLGGGATSIFDGLVVAATVIAWSALIDRLCYFFPTLSRLLEPASVCLIENGIVHRRQLRAQFITHEELMEQLRLNGIEKITDVQRAYLEPNGEISVIPRDNDDRSARDTGSGGPHKSL